MRTSKLIGLALLASLLISCSNNVEGKTPAIKRITMGTERSQAGRIQNPRKEFSVKDRMIYFNAELTNITKKVPVTAYWVLNNEGGHFTTYSVSAEPGSRLAKFHLEKGSDWKAGTYTIHVDIGTGATVPTMSAVYTVK